MGLGIVRLGDALPDAATEVVADPWTVDLAIGRARIDATPVVTIGMPPPTGYVTTAPTLIVGGDRAARLAVAASHTGDDRVIVHDSTGDLVAAVRAALATGLALVVEAAAPPPVAELERLARFGARIFAASSRPDAVPPPGWGVLTVGQLTTEHRRARWRVELARRRERLDPSELAAVDVIAAGANVGAGTIGQAAQLVADREARDAPLDVPTLRRALRDTSRADLSAVAHHVETTAGWDDLIVPPTVRAQLRSIADAITHLDVVVDEWGFGERPGPLGLHLLFSGPSGTGKTLSASVLAGVCQLELWVVDLARVVDKYLGETEKHLDRVFEAAADSSALLLFDEADALFGKRGDVREAKDRWANIEVAYLLQRIERHRGVTVLTTNLGHHIDAAFARRMGHRVEFHPPDARNRRLLWQRCLPERAPLTDAAILDEVADRFELSGGAIRSAALNAALAGAADGGVIEARHIVAATVQELTKAGRAPTRTELVGLGER